MTDKKIITPEYLAGLLSKIAQGERPQKVSSISQKAFLEQMLPHVKAFLAQDYTYKAIAEFIGHISISDLKKAVKKSLAEDKEREKAVKKEQTKTAQKKKKTVASKPVGAKSIAKSAQAGNAAP